MNLLGGETTLYIQKNTSYPTRSRRLQRPTIKSYTGALTSLGRVQVQEMGLCKVWEFTLEPFAERGEFQFSTLIKFEHMPENKAPRFLIADQDEGQILSLLTIKCVEDLTKRAFPKKTIKGKSKKEAMEELINELAPPAKHRTGEFGMYDLTLYSTYLKKNKFTSVWAVTDLDV